jgi:endo-1,4-beta-D-glucanase Y
MHITRKFSLILVALLAGLCLACQEEPSKASLARVLTSAWQSYGRHFITPDGRVMVPEEGGGTISEAQAYALLRAVWVGDQMVFNRVYSWTYNHLGRHRAHGDSLLAWRWGRRPDGSWGVLDANSATDGDLDYALALILADRKGWRAPPGLPDFREEARRVQAAILAREVVALPNGELLLTPGNWHEPQPPYLVNPSYFSPAAYRLFAKLSPPENLEREAKATEASPRSPSPSMGEGRGGGEKKFSPLPLTPSQQGRRNSYQEAVWGDLHRSTYEVLGQINRGLGGQPGVGLFPDWCRMDAAGRLAPAPGRDTRFGWEAVRIPFRLALDGLWFGEPRAARLLKEKFLPFFKNIFKAQGRLLAVYNFDGAPAADYESPVLYAGVLAGALAAGDRDFAREMALKVLSFYREDGPRAYFEAPDHYYANNWAWLGLALYAGWVKPGN